MGLFDSIKKGVTDASQKINDSVKNFKVEDITSNLKGYEKYFSDSELKQKIEKFGKTMGATILYPVLLLYNLLKSGDVDIKEKAMIVGTLGYVILPLDLFPDGLPGGFTDDELGLLAAITALASCLTEDIQQTSKTQLHDMLGEFDERVLDSVADIIKGAHNFINRR